MTATPLDRRRFLALAAGTLATGALGGCTRRRTGGAGAPGSPSASVATPPSRSSSPPDWAALRSRLSGPLVLPGEAAYPAARRLYGPRYDDARPSAVAYCASPADVARTLAFVQDHDVALATPRRCHSYGGWSTGRGLVLDVTRMAGVG